MSARMRWVIAAVVVHGLWGAAHAEPPASGPGASPAAGPGAALPGEVRPRGLSGQVVRVTAFNTLVVREGDRETSLKLGGVEAVRGTDPEAARVFLENLLLGEDVRAEPAGRESDVRRGALVLREPDGLDVNLELVRQGFAALDERAAQAAFGGALDTFRELARRARAFGKGMYREPRPPASAPADAPAAGQAVQPPAPTPAPGSAPATPAPAGPGTPVPVPTPTPTPAPAATPAGSGEVFVTPSGKKYHRAGCRFVTANARAIPLAEAREKYEPCSACDPDR